MPERVRRYHHISTHRKDAYAPSPGFLDWESQPNPFRNFDGCRRIDLPFSNHVIGMRYDEALRQTNLPKRDWSLDPIATMLELGFGLSGWKTLGPERWALRHNPSSGNLHPTEVYLITWETQDPRLNPGVYHYEAHDHRLECRCLFSNETQQILKQAFPGYFGALGLSSILWREEWKYGARGYRYCQLDIGHALGAAAFGGLSQGWSLTVAQGLGDDMLAAILGLDRKMDYQDVEPELPEVLALISPIGDYDANPEPREIESENLKALIHHETWYGTPNRLSAEFLQWPESRGLTGAIKRAGTKIRLQKSATRAASDDLDASEDLGVLIRRRRSAQRMDKDRSTISFRSFAQILGNLDNGLTCATKTDDRGLILALYVHQVSGLEPGRYVWQAPQGWSAHEREDCVKGLTGLDRLGPPEDIRREASKLCCHQGIAGHGAIAFAIFGDLGPRLEQDPAYYRNLHWQAGGLGQQLYLAAENLGLQGTGIGCFFDDEVKEFWGLRSDKPWAPIYHFTIGAAKPDQRMQDSPPYAHLKGRGPVISEDAVRTQIANTWATREAIKQALNAKQGKAKEGLDRLDRIDRLLSDFDTAFKTLHDKKSA